MDSVQTILSLRDIYNLIVAAQRIAQHGLPDAGKEEEEILPPTKVDEIQDALENLTSVLNDKGVRGIYKRR